MHDRLGLAEIDATDVARATGRVIAMGAVQGGSRGLAVWRELLSTEFNFVQSRSFPLFVALGIRWIGGSWEPPATGNTYFNKTRTFGETHMNIPHHKKVLSLAVATGLSSLLPVADSFVVTELTGTPGEPPALIDAWLQGLGARSEVAPDVAAGLRTLRERPGPRLVVGSFYLAGAVRQLLGQPS